MSERGLLSVVVPVYCEEENLPEFHRRCTAACAAVGDMNWEIVFVDDGSKDRSAEIVRALCDTDPHVRLVRLSRNFGHQWAITAGIDHARGDAVVLIDGDLQDPPELIGRMIERWRDGAMVVYGRRNRRRGESPVKAGLASFFYRVLARLSEIPIPLDTGDFRLMDRAVADVVRGLREQNRYLRGLVSWAGFRQEALLYDRDPRFAGEPKYNLTKSLRLALDGITGFSNLPLRLSSQLGFAATGLALLAALWTLGGKLLRPETVIGGWTTLMIAVLFLGGVQLLSIGVLGEYVARIYRESQHRPLYVVAEKRGGTDARAPGAAP